MTTYDDDVDTEGTTLLNRTRARAHARASSARPSRPPQLLERPVLRSASPSLLSTMLSPMLRVLLAAYCTAVLAQPSYTLPPPCPLSTYAPGDEAPAFTLQLTSGTFALPAPRGSPLLPLVLFAVDSARDPGGVLLATDAPELDKLFAVDAPARGTLLFVSHHGDGAELEAVLEARLALVPKDRADGWRARLAFGLLPVDELRKQGSPLAALLDGWQSPRLLVKAPAEQRRVGSKVATALDGVETARVDGRYECWPWPDVSKSYEVRGPFQACDPRFCPIDIPDGALLLLTNATADGGACDAEAATAWAMKEVPNAAGAMIGTPAPAVVGRGVCPERSFFPMIVSEAAAEQLGHRLDASPFLLTANYSCESGTWLGVRSDGKLATIGWRKYNAAYALRWALEHLTYLDGVEAAAGEASFELELVPARSPINAITRQIEFSPRRLREAYRSELDFTFGCPGVGDNDCGPWDRIVTATARCWPSAQPPTPLPPPLEIARYITPYRKADGRWLTSADALVGLVGNGSVDGLDVPWTCEVGMSSCCEPWLGTLTLRLFDPLSLASKGVAAPSEEGVPFAVIPLAFANSDTHFGPDYNTNRVMLFTPPVRFSRALLRVIISGHGAAAPPPLGQGCEFAPTSHAFALGPASTAPAGRMSANTSEVAFDQFMRASTELGCAVQVSGTGGGGGSMAGQHGAWIGGRNGWCPGMVVRPVSWDVTAALAGGIGPCFVQHTALSYWTDLSHASAEGCGGDIQFSGELIFYS